jgi:AI-2 transport protein TqsA
MITPEDRQRVQTACLAILAFIAAAGAMYLLRPVLLPFVLAIFLTCCLSPVMELQVRMLRLHPVAAFIGTLLITCVILFVCGLIVTGAIAQITENASTYEAQVENAIQRGIASFPVERLGVKRDQLFQAIDGALRNGVTQTLTEAVVVMMDLLSTGTLVLIFVIFMLADRAHRGPSLTGVSHNIDMQVKRYLLAMIVCSAVTGFLVGATLAVVGVRFAWLFGFLAFALNFIPNVGSVIATLLPVPVILLSPELGVAAKIMAVAGPSVIQVAIGYVFQPRLMGRSLDLHPVVILLSLIFFGRIWGLPGMFLATPITAVLKIMMEHFEYTKPLAGLLAGNSGKRARNDGR